MTKPQWTYKSNSSLGSFNERQPVSIPILVYDDEDRNTIETNQFENNTDSTILPNYATDQFFYVKSTGIPYNGIIPLNPPGYDQYVVKSQSYVFKFPRYRVNINGENNTRRNTNTPTINFVGVAVNGVPFKSSNSGKIVKLGDSRYTENSVLYPIQDYYLDGSGLIGPDGKFYYQSDPSSVYIKNQFEHSPIIGYAFDGNPIYGPYGYSDPNDNTSNIKLMESSYRLRNEQRSNNTIPDGTFIEDFVFVGNSGDLDKHNGRHCITPEYPDGVYAYFITVDYDGQNYSPRYPYIIGPTYFNEPLLPNGDFDFPGEIHLEIISGELPPGLRLSGLSIVGVPFNVTTDTEFRFVLRASNPNGISDRTYTITITGSLPPIWATPEGDLEIGTKGKRTESIKKSIAQDVIKDSRIIHMRSILGILVGSIVDIPLQDDSTSAYTNCIIENTKVTEVDVPNKTITLSKPIVGFIPRGIVLRFTFTFTHNNLFVLDNSFINYQLSAVDPDATSKSVLKYYIPSKGGELPPGLTLTVDGKITGTIEPIIAADQGDDNNGAYDMNLYDKFAYDYGIRPYNGYDSFLFDNQVFDFFDITRHPKKLNRYYQFIVRVFDGRFYSDRRFRIYVVGDDFFHADNTIMQVGTGTYTADITYLRKPIWISGSYFTGDPEYPSFKDNSYYLGKRRANNYITTFLDVFDPATLQGNIGYVLDGINNDPIERILQRSYSVGSKILKLNSIDNLKVGSYVTFPINPNNITYIPADTKITKIDYVNKEIYIDKALIYPVQVESTIIITSASRLPPGMILDQLSGEIYGDVPFQPAVTETYKFTVRAIRYNPSSPDFGIERITTSSNIIGDTVLQVDSLSNLRIGSFVSSPIGSGFISPGTTISDIDVLNKRITLSKPIVTSLNAGTRLIFSFIISSTRTFSLDIIGELDSTIEFKTPGDLGIIPANFTSGLSVYASTNIKGAILSYTIIGGKIPPGLTFVNDGTIQGKVNQYATTSSPGLTSFDNNTISFDQSNTTIDREYTFIVLAQDQFKYSATTKIFNLKVTTPNNLLYSNIVVKPFLPVTNRLLVSDFFTNPNIFEKDFIYRLNDPAFGIQSDLKMLLYSGIETVNAAEYAAALGRSSRKKFRFGSLKKAIAKTPGTNNIIYEVIFVEMIDNMENEYGSIPKNIDIRYKNYPIKTNQGKRDILDNDTYGEIITDFDAFAGDSSIVVSQSSIKQLKLFDSITSKYNSFFPRGTCIININVQTRDVTLNQPLVENMPAGTKIYTDRDILKNIWLQDKVMTADFNGQFSSDFNKSNIFGNSVTNIRSNISILGETERNFLPLWMRTPQTFTGASQGFTKAVVLCYCNPGYGDRIMNNIKKLGINFNSINYTIDRIIIDSVVGESGDKYIAFAAREVING